MLFLWLYNSIDQTDIKTNFNRNHIIQIPIDKEKIIMASCGSSSCCALNENGELYYWNEYVDR